LSDCEEKIQSVQFNTPLLDTNSTLQRFLHDAESYAETVRGSIAATSDVQSGVEDKISTLLNPASNHPSPTPLPPSSHPIFPETHLVRKTHPAPEAHPVSETHHISAIQTSTETGGNALSTRTSRSRFQPVMVVESWAVTDATSPPIPLGRPETQLQRFIKSWNSSNRQVKVAGEVPLEEKGFQRWILDAAVSPDSRHVAVLSCEASPDSHPAAQRVHLALWTLSGTNNPPLITVEFGHCKCPRGVCLWFAESNNLRAVFTFNPITGKIRNDFQFSEWVLSSHRTWKQVHPAARPGLNLTSPFTPSQGGRALLCGEKSGIKSLSLLDFQKTLVLEIPTDGDRNGDEELILHISFVSGSNLLLLTRRTSVLLIDMRTKQTQQKWSSMDLGVQPDHRCTKSWLSTSMKTLVVCYRRIDSPWDKHILLDVNNTMKPRILARFGGHAHPTFSTDGSFLIVQDNSGFKYLNLHVVDTSDGTVKLKIPSSENPLFRTFTTFSSDGNTIVWADDALRREINRTRICYVQF
jgi:hypothetical protein